jgi:DNA-binding LacI/PurR family transcriptional regulator
MLAPTRHSLISGVAGSLREAIESGEFRDHLPGVRALSRDLCVSVPTILEAIKALESEGAILVKQGCPTRILSPVKDGSGESEVDRKTVVLLGFSPIRLDEPHFRDVVDRLRKQGYAVVSHQFGSWKFSQPEAERLVALHPAACWVLMGSAVAAQEFFSGRKLPCLVACGSSGDGVHLPDFEMDFSALYRHVANQFLNLGHRRFHLIIGEQSAQKNPKCLEAFVTAVQQREPNRQIEDLIVTYDQSTEGLKALLEELFRPVEKPTGLCVALVSRYILTQGWLLAKGFRIPEDVSLICRDGDDLLMDCIIPAPSHYAYRTELYGRRLARAIASLLETGKVKDHTLLIPEFVKGDSMGPVPVKKKAKSRKR